MYFNNIVLCLWETYMWGNSDTLRMMLPAIYFVWLLHFGEHVFIGNTYFTQQVDMMSYELA